MVVRLETFDSAPPSRSAQSIAPLIAIRFRAHGRALQPARSDVFPHPLAKIPPAVARGDEQ